MRILVISDTHGDTYKAEKVIRQNEGISLIIHLGDYCRDAQKLSGIFPNIPIEYIYGNCDFKIEGVEAEKLLECKGKKIFITHGHRYSVKWGYDKLYKKAEEMQADVLLFGHTHVAHITCKGNCYVVNPGSISYPRAGSNKSYAIIELDEGKLESKLCFV
jgi:putative phosphoesterase